MSLNRNLILVPASFAGSFLASRLLLVHSYCEEVQIAVSLVFSVLFALGALVIGCSKVANKSSRLLLLLASTAVPGILVYLISAFVFGQSAELSNLFAVLAGCFSLMAMIPSLFASAYWWLLFSILFPPAAIYGFWTMVYFFNRHWRLDTDFQPGAILFDVVFYAFCTITERQSETNANVWTWSLLSLLTFCSIVLLWRLIKRQVFAIGNTKKCRSQ